VTAPLPELVAGLAAFRPAALMGYTTALKVLAEEQRAGRLKLRPAYVIPSAEHLDDATRADFARAWGCPVRDIYSASEFMGIAMGCSEGWMHVNSDWCIVESVDENHRPAKPGGPGHTTLLTNLANRAQPLLRYDIGDRIVERAGPCPCGSPLPAIRVEGRTDDILYFRGAGGPIPVIPKAIGAIVEESPGLQRYQLVQTAPDALRVRLEPGPGRSGEEVWRTVQARLAPYLAAQGLGNVRVERAAEGPQRDPRSGKYLHAWAEREVKGWQRRA
jgi:phenylacetate-coenzyme A ligase PaaK-like adenylate-forming protein